MKTEATGPGPVNQQALIPMVIAHEGSHWPLWRDIDSNAYIRDIDWAERLRYERPRSIRDLIKRMIKAGQLGFVVCRTVRQTPGSVGGRTATEYYLTQAQALKVAMHSETKLADQMANQMIAVFLLARSGRTEEAAKLAGAAEHAPPSSDAMALAMGQIAGAMTVIAQGQQQMMSQQQAQTRALLQILSQRIDPVMPPAAPPSSELLTSAARLQADDWIANPAAFGDLLRWRRETARLTRVELGQRAGLADSTIRNIEMGRHAPTRFTIACLLGVKELGLAADEVPPYRLVPMRPEPSQPPPAVAKTEQPQAEPPPRRSYHDPLPPKPSTPEEDAFAKRELERMLEYTREDGPARAVAAAAPATPAPAQPRLPHVPDGRPHIMGKDPQERYANQAHALIATALGKGATPEQFSAAYRTIYADMKPVFDAWAKAAELGRSVGRQLTPMDAIKMCRQGQLLLRYARDWARRHPQRT